MSAISASGYPITEKNSTAAYAAPHRWRILLEAQGILERSRLALQYKTLTRTRSQFAYPIILLPGFGTDERSMQPLARYLKDIGAEVYDWGIGSNHGYVPGLLAELTGKISLLAAQRQSIFHLIGWSMGGYLARELAREKSELVAKVVTLGTPIVGGVKYTAVARFYARWGFDLDAMERDAEARAQIPLKNEILAIYSRGDNIVDWRACIDTRTEGACNFEVGGSHWGLTFNVCAYRRIRLFLEDTLATAPDAKL